MISAITQSQFLLDDDTTRQQMWRWAWFVFLGAIGLRLFFFGGYALGDDLIFAKPPTNVIRSGYWDYTNAINNRILMVIPQIISFTLFSFNDVSFVLPIFVFAIGTHAISLFFVRDFLNERAALITSLLFLTCPFETLAATSFAPNYIVSFYCLTCFWACYRGYRQQSRWAMGWGGLFLGCALFTKASALLSFPVLGLAALLTIRHWKLWLYCGATFFSVVASVSLWYWYILGEPFHWYFFRTDPPWGHDVTDSIGFTVSIFPKYVFWKEWDYGHWMFGWTGWLSVFGVLLAGYCLMKRRYVLQSGMVLLFCLYILLFNFTPHKIDFTAYYSHPRIFRYLSQIAVYFYLISAFFIEIAYRGGVLQRQMALAFLGMVLIFGLVQAPLVSRPTWDSTQDGKALNEFFETTLLEKLPIYGDYWNCSRLIDLSYPKSANWEFNCKTFENPKHKHQYLSDIREGYVITGGGSLAWYSSKMWILNLSEADFAPPSSWEKIFQYDAPLAPWRKEPLRVWKALSERIPISDMNPELERCLRQRVHPLRPQDGIPHNQPIFTAQALYVFSLECPSGQISNLQGLEYFSNLKVLNLGNNQLTSIDFSPFKHLQMVLLANNQLAEIQGLETAKELHTLWVAGNQLTSIDLSSFSHLVDVRLDNNRLEQVILPDNAQQMKHLDLSGNPKLDCGAVLSNGKPKTSKCDGL